MGYSIFRGTAGAGTKPPLRRRVLYGGDLIKQEDVSAASYSVYERQAGSRWEPVAGHTDVELVVTAIVFDELQPWDTDDTGFNVQVPFASELDTPLAEIDHEYRVAVLLVFVDGTADGFAWEIRTP